MIDVVAAVIKNQNDKFLIALRGKGRDYENHWEFPGGKVEKGESLESALVREIKEELLIDIKVCEYITEIETLFKGKKYRIVAFMCSILDGFVTLTEHQDLTYVSADELYFFKMSPADSCIRDHINVMYNS